MAQLVPENFDIGVLPPSEQRVVRHLLDGLDESWIVIPSVPITHDGADREIDVVLVSFDRGAWVIEVKGGIVTVVDGQWKSYDTPIKNPARQVTAAKYALIKRLQKTKTPAARVHISHLVALPDNADFPREGAGPECPRDIVLTRNELTNIATTLETMGHPRPSTRQEIESLIKALRPDVSEIRVDGRHVKGVLTRLSDATAERLGPVIGLDENRRVYLRGSAGTGKTFVALRWFRRALLRRESALYVCFNSPLASDVESKISSVVETLTESDNLPPMHMVANFHALMRRLMGDSAPPIPKGDESVVQNYWNVLLPEAFAASLPTIDLRFDTIIIDEAQDFHPTWLEVVEGLMSDRVNGRLYLMADSDQAIYTSSWTPPAGITTLELTHNIRNSGNIARVVASLGGAPVPRSVPAGPAVGYHRVGGMKETAKAVRSGIRTASEELGIPHSQIAILVSHRSVRDELRTALAAEFHLVPWQDRDENAIVCETVHRTKGLERQAVILVDIDEEPNRTIAYVGASRASAYLSVVGREPLISLMNGSPGSN